MEYKNAGLWFINTSGEDAWQHKIMVKSKSRGLAHTCL